ncbi:hypothetical protein KHP62_00305 [Rhodobacteraceae bacterium NNCM2]|nr:hypothetical protein [Coraliihabitans acroporae]
MFSATSWGSEASGSDMTTPHSYNEPDDLPEPPALRRLRLLVTVLTSVLIIGMLTMVTIFVIRLGGIGTLSTPSPQAPIEAESLTLPTGAEITAVGRGQKTVLITTEGPAGEILHVFDAATGAPLSTIEVKRD